MKNSLQILFLFFGVLVFSQQRNVFDVARSGTVDEMKALMKINPDTINSVNEMSFSPLILASYRGNKEVASFLMDHVSDVNYESQEGTALAALCMNYDKNLVEKILSKKANPNLKDGHGNTPLFWAIKRQNAELAEILLKNGAKKEIKDNSGLSLFEYALQTQNHSIINLLKN